MNNLEKIKKAWAMGWSATIVGKYSVVGIDCTRILVTTSRIGFRYFTENQIENTNITGYLYAGELAGNEPIPEGQKFKVKDCGTIVESTGEQEIDWGFMVSVYDKHGSAHTYRPEQIEPYFE